MDWLSVSRHPKFQSTFPQGERLWGNHPDRNINRCFNPRSRKGNDDRAKAKKAAQPMFQSTFPQGERHPLDVVTDTDLIVSIHVPARGTTSLNTIFSSLLFSFNPRSRKGNDYYEIEPESGNISFNPRSRKGNDIHWTW